MYHAKEVSCCRRKGSWILEDTKTSDKEGVPNLANLDLASGFGGICHNPLLLDFITVYSKGEIGECPMPTVEFLAPSPALLLKFQKNKNTD